MRTILGIDPGLDGGLVLLDETGKVLFKEPIPVIEIKKPYIDKKTKKEKIRIKRLLDLVELNRLFEQVKHADHSYIESVAAYPGQGVSSVFTFGRVLGALEAYLIAHGMPHTFVTPSTWAKNIHAGISSIDDPKGRSRIALNRLFPKDDFRPTAKSKNPHEGTMDAALIAEFGRREMFVKGEKPTSEPVEDLDDDLELPDFP